MARVSDILYGAADLLSQEEAFVSGFHASDHLQEFEVHPRSKEASCWDISGAIEKVAPDDDPEIAPVATKVVIDFLGLGDVSDLDAWNDENSREAVVNLLREVAGVESVFERYGERLKGSFAYKCWQRDVAFRVFGLSGYAIRGSSLPSLHTNVEAGRLRRARIFNDAYLNLGNLGRRGRDPDSPLIISRWHLYQLDALHKAFCHELGTPRET